MLLNGLNNDIQLQLLNTDYADFQHMVDKAIVIENKIKEMEKDDKLANGLRLGTVVPKSGSEWSQGHRAWVRAN
jgi:hypothetical protein